MELGLTDRGAVVLASSSGLGFAVAKALLAEGARVALSGRDATRLDAALHELGRTNGDRAWGEPVDLTDGAALERHLSRAREHLGAIDVLVLNAGGPPPASAAAARDEDLDRAFELTFKSAVRATRAVLPGMRERGFGRIVAMTSIAVREPIPDLVHSNAMRAALTGYLKTLASEVAAEGVTVNTVCTGMFATARLFDLFADRSRKAGTSPEEAAARAVAAIPVGRLGDPDEFGAVVAFLASERAAFLTGVSLPVDGGASHFLL
jgi:3-oxoacyl-[acyl-carrier protein] reductase